MFITAVLIERDLGVPSVSFNTLTGHRSRAPEDCGERPIISPQGPAPVTGIFPAGGHLHLLVGWGRAALPGLLPVGFPAPPAAPGVRLSPHRALHVPWPLAQPLSVTEGSGYWFGISVPR